ncbi:TlpA family protein disulfide reductase [Aliamphritea spongicola]|uniref:TlpA family protein disulfide reductase n=1 Tax=Aliamphritea spongicola TaxID=707589 RepID=UPI00196A5E03|nr:TlpA disulfide reductase family protein [Aliamphritea spongicola]MBN3562492.1 TlpA family protein disulfide reductase [Aliamphritea spongicola]
MRKCRLLVSVWLMMLFSLSAQAMALKSWEGDDTSLQQQVGKGKWAVVIFWRHDCEFCKREVPGLSAFHERNKDTQAEVIGVSIDGYGNKALAEEFVAENQPAFPSLIGEIQTVARSFQQLTEEGLRGTPTYMLFNPQGQLVAIQPGLLDPAAIEAFIAQRS